MSELRGENTSRQAVGSPPTGPILPGVTLGKVTESVMEVSSRCDVLPGVIPYSEEDAMSVYISTAVYYLQVWGISVSSAPFCLPDVWSPEQVEGHSFLEAKCI